MKSRFGDHPKDDGHPLEITRRGFGLLAGAMAVSSLPLGPTDTAAAAYPEGPVRVVIPLPPGGIADIVARVMQPHLESAFGKPFVIENRPGASGIVGANAVLNSPPDGHTLLFVTTTYSINAALRPSVQQIKRLEAVGIAAEGSQLFLLNPKVPATSLKEFVALAKAEPNKYFYASTGIASHAHLLFELFSQQAGIKMKHVPYPGGPPAVMAAVNGEVHITLISPAASLPHIREGALRALATGGAVREAELPDVPTAAEAGFPDFNARQWIGLLAPPGAPKPLIKALNTEMQRVLERADVRTVLARQGLNTSSASPEEFQQLIDQEVKLWADVARRAGIKVAE